MAAVNSTMLPLGTPAPSFALPDAVSGRTVSVSDYAQHPAFLVMFICNHCPFVKHIRAELARLGQDYGARGVAIVAINSNDVTKYPDDSPEKMREEAAAAGYTFPYLFDETQDVAKAYHAACTPDFYVFDRAKRLVYRGQLDDSRPKNDTAITGKDLRAALDAALADRPAPEPQYPSIGCNIKWRPSNEPDYFKH
jgi:thiol-disulfide isomerase/thioredoxin